MDQALETYIITFDMVDTVVKPRKLGKVHGSVLGPTALDLVNQNGSDFVRVFTSGNAEYLSRVTILQLTTSDDGFLPVVGELTGLGKADERFIGPVLLHGDRAFFTTNSYTGSLYTIDLSDPTNPTQLGYIEAPGGLTNLYPIDESLLLGFGHSVPDDACDRNFQYNFQVVLYDMANSSRPLIQLWEENVNTTVMKTQTASQAEFDSRMVQYDAKSKTLIIPIMMMEYVKQRHCVDCWQEGKVFDGFRAFKIDAETGIQEQWSIAHYFGDLLEDDVCYGYGSVAPRSLILDDSPHDLITLKGHSVLVHNLTTAPIISATGVDLDADNTDCSGDYFYGADAIASWNPFV